MKKLPEDKELQKFYKELQEDIKIQHVSADEGTTPEQVFTEHALLLLADAGETENCRVSYDEKISKRGVEHKISGYSLYENYETLDLFITQYFPDDKIQSVTKTEAEKAVDKLVKFFKNAIYNYYVNELDEASQIFDLAHTLATVPEIKQFLTRVNMFFITNGSVKSDLKFSDKFSEYSVFYRVIDINYLFNISNQERIPIEIDFTEKGFQVPCIENNIENPFYKSYLAIIPGNALAHIYEQYGSRLLEQNVRSFLQFTGKYNQGIRKTILEKPQMFLAYNNGIAVTAEEIKLVNLPGKNRKGIGFVKDFQIVNGGQTTASIYHTCNNNPEIDSSKILVQLKITIIKDKDNFSEIVGNIAEFSNTQNKVSASDLSSNRENHIILEKISRTIWAPPTKNQDYQTRWFFERARGQYKNERSREGYTPSRRKAFDRKNPRQQMLTKETLAKYINAWEEVYKDRGKKPVIAPHIVVRGNQKNYAQFLNHNYKNKPDNIFFEDTVAKAIIFKTAEKIYGVKPNALGDMRYITVPYTVGWLGFKLDYKLDLYKIWKKQELSDALKTTLGKVMIKVEKYIKKNAPGSLYGEWAKKEECWAQIKKEDFGINLDILSDDLVNKKSLQRKSLTESDIENELVQSELQLIKSIPLNKWDEISKMGKHLKELSPYLVGSAINIMAAIKLEKKFTDTQRENALKLIDIMVKKAPDFFDSPEKGDNTETRTKSSVKINVKLLEKMVLWDTEAKVLKKHELQYVSDFAYGLKKLNSFHEKNLERHYNKLLSAGFSVK